MVAKRRFDKDDWAKVLRRLKRAKELVEGKPSEDDLDNAVIQAWSSGEYLINACLELKDLPVVRNHTQHVKARELKDLGVLQGDYFDSLEKLQRYRKAAEYLGYDAQKTTHYNRQSVVNCIEDVAALLGEVEALLLQEGLI